jgi:hypothetical protein
MLVLDLDGLACDTRCLRGMGDGAKGFLGLLLHPCLVLSRRILDHLRVGRERMKRGKTVSTVALAPIRLTKAMPCSTAFPASPSVGIRILVYIALSLITAF